MGVILWLLLKTQSNANYVETLSSPFRCMTSKPAPVAPVQLMVGMIISGDAHHHRMTSLI